MIRALGLVGLLLLADAAVAEGQSPRPPSPGIATFLEVDGGPGFPLGSWTDHPGYPETSRFGPGGGGRLSLGWAPNRSPWFTAGLEVGFQQLGTSDYERFARGRGVPLAASARWWSVAAGGTVHLPGRGRSPFGVELHGALGVLAPSGEDRLQGRSFDYEFLQTTLAGWLGARGAYRLSSMFEVWSGVELMVAPGAIRNRSDSPYLGDQRAGDGRSRTAVSLEPRVGLRTWFDL